MTDFSFQLYSARNFPPLSDTLAMLSRLGYRQVEGFGGVYDDPAAVKADLDANGLTMPTGHFGLDQLRDKAGTLAIARALGVETIICPFVPQERWKQPDTEWVGLARELGDLAKTYRDEMMGNLAKQFCGYGWETNVGYPTPEHREGIRQLGITPYHRKSFTLLPEQMELFG